MSIIIGKNILFSSTIFFALLVTLYLILTSNRLQLQFVMKRVFAVQSVLFGHLACMQQANEIIKSSEVSILS